MVVPQRERTFTAITQGLPDMSWRRVGGAVPATDESGGEEDGSEVGGGMSFSVTQSGGECVYGGLLV